MQALAVLSYSEALTANSQNLSSQWGDVKDTLNELLDSILDIAVASQKLKDATEDFECGRTDSTPVDQARQELYEARNRFYHSLFKYLYETQQFESNGQYQYGTSPYPLTKPYYVPNNLYPNSYPPIHYPSQTIPTAAIPTDIEDME